MVKLAAMMNIGDEDEDYGEDYGGEEDDAARHFKKWTLLLKTLQLILK